MQGVKENIINVKFGKLTVISLQYTKNNRSFWLCKCDCGNTIIVKRIYLQTKTTKSCGCLRKEKIKKRNIKHKMKYTSFYGIWGGIKNRCNNVNSWAYKWYGDRGITYNPRWNDFIEFKKDMYWKYLLAKFKYRKILTKNNPISIERKDVNLDYCKENCIWIPLNEQGKNTRRTKNNK